MEYDFSKLMGDKGSEEEPSDDAGGDDGDEMLDMSIDAAMGGSGDAESRREAFKRAVCLLIDQERPSK